MKLRLIKSCVVAGYPGLSKGDIFEADAAVGGRLLGMGLAIEEKFAPRVGNPEGIQTRDPAVANREPKAQSPKAGKAIRPSRPA
jgi:hypothetical protein